MHIMDVSGGEKQCRSFWSTFLAATLSFRSEPSALRHAPPPAGIFCFVPHTYNNHSAAMVSSVARGVAWCVPAVVTDNSRVFPLYLAGVITLPA